MKRRSKRNIGENYCHGCNLYKIPRVFGKKMSKYKKIQEAGKILDYINKDEHEKWLAEQRMIYKMDQNAVEEFGYHKGKKEGEKEEKIRIVKNLLKKNMKLEEIMEITELSKEEIETIQNNP